MEFREFITWEIPRTFLPPGTWMNKGMKKGQGLEQPRPFPSKPRMSEDHTILYSLLYYARITNLNNFFPPPKSSSQSSSLPLSRIF